MSHKISPAKISFVNLTLDQDLTYVFQIERKLKRKRKQKRKRGSLREDAKRPRVGVLPRCVFVFVFVLIYVESEFRNLLLQKSNGRSQIIVPRKRENVRKRSKTPENARKCPKTSENVQKRPKNVRKSSVQKSTENKPEVFATSRRSCGNAAAAAAAAAAEPSYSVAILSEVSL